MISGIGLSTGGSLSGIGGGTAAQRGEGAQRVSSKPAVALEDRAAVSSTVSQLAAQGAPIDGDRVAALKAAIKGGTYRADPAKIAGSMIDADLGASL